LRLKKKPKDWSYSMNYPERYNTKEENSSPSCNWRGFCMAYLFSIKQKDDIKLKKCRKLKK
jgi:hypothetical protein